MNIKKIVKEEINLFEVSDELYDLLKKNYSNSRLVMTKDEQINFRPQKKEQRIGGKPNGLWYGIGTQWIDWVKVNDLTRKYDNIFELILDENKIILIKNIDEIKDFTKSFVVKDEKLDDFLTERDYFIDWKSVAEQFSGIEISPYIWSAKNVYGWYYAWDIASGCVWDSDAIKLINKITISL